MAWLDPHSEIWVSIFHQLPIRFALRCKLVCKTWHSLLSHPSFIQNYKPSSVPLNPPLNAMLIPYTNSTDVVVTFEINGSAGDPKFVHFGFHRGVFITVLGSWNGLVALCNRFGDFCLFNPYTKEEKVVSKAVSTTHVFFSCFYGLCHDPALDEFKAVVCRLSTEFFVVSFKDGSCKVKTQPELLGDLEIVEGSSLSSTIVKGVPHWICHVNASETDSIVYFDQQVEEFRRIRLPKARGARGNALSLGALDGQLTVALRDQTRGGDSEVWALDEYEKECSWSMLFVIANYSCFMTILAWMTDYEVLIYDTLNVCLKAYNVRDRRVRQVLRSDEVPSVDLTLHHIVTYIPSLVSPNQCG